MSRSAGIQASRTPKLIIATTSVVVFSLFACCYASALPSKPAKAATTAKKRAKTKNKSNATAPRATVQTPTPSAAPVLFDIVHRTLPSGMHVVIQPDPSTTAVAISMVIRVGSTYEKEGQFGFAQALYSHFRTTQPYDRSHASPDLLQFTTVASPSSLPVILRQQSNRLTSPFPVPAFVESSNSHASGVTPGRPAGHSLRALLDVLPTPSQRAQLLAYQGSFAYGHPSFGWTNDLCSASASVNSASSIEMFRRQYVIPSHTVLVVVGPVSPELVMDEVHRLFASVPALPLVQPPVVELPDQTNQRVDIERLAEPESQMFLYGWSVPSFGHEDYAAVRLVSEMLSDWGDETQLVHSPLLALLPTDASLQLDLEPRFGPSWFTLRVDLPSTLDIDRTRRVVDDTLLSLARHGPTQDQMVMGYRRAMVRGITRISRVRDRAEDIGLVLALGHDASVVFSFPTELLSVDRFDVQRVVRKYLTPIRRNLVERRWTRLDQPASGDASLAGVSDGSSALGVSALPTGTGGVGSHAVSRAKGGKSPSSAGKPSRKSKR